jgi:uncharacterized protein
VKKFGRLIFVVCLAGAAGWMGFGLSGCDKPAPAVSAPAAGPAIPGLPTQAQPRLRTMQLWVGSKPMVAELALSPIEEETGMMFRTNMGANDGMFFVLPYPQRASFWMMNCFVPLSAAYIGVDGTILEIHDLQPHDTNAVVATSDSVQFVLETPQGWFLSNNIPAGTVISTEKGTLQQVFLRR